MTVASPSRTDHLPCPYPSTFWRDPALPFLEAREVLDGRRVCYARHSHETFSIGAVTGGRSTYLNGGARETVGRGSVVVMNPDAVHACNPIGGDAWAYRMLFVDTAWLGSLQRELGFGDGQDLHLFDPLSSTDATLYEGLNRLYDVCTDASREVLERESVVQQFFIDVHERLNPAPRPMRDDSHKLHRAADFIRAHCCEALTLAQICDAAGLSASYLTRAFRARFGLTPHAFLMNRRIQYARSRLRRGHAIAEVALDAGFADQAHFQRTFKQLLAATPGHYREARAA
ncbi:AraC family transcriptional regulator [Pandoraea faecigallinarum]|uniref:AraC family transcriptional regulator n=1 Tax=Pandoraea faecigallinarum TaxID=656179 RepID=A0A0H3WWC9_9BURK|nr:AraC family transcriptional regulator [Pandoraea faecigallinarum]AKM30918.1 AraC family transcriptional regulator [Pandoraea faecigallinarum]